MSGKQSALMPKPQQILPGRPQSIVGPLAHAVSGHPLQPPYPQGFGRVLFGMGCFWGAERRFWQLPGVYVTAVGYAGGDTPNPSYQDVCSGLTGHAEVVLVIHDPKVIGFSGLLKVFWESHDPTQGMRQGNDRGTQYRSALYTTEEYQQKQALLSREYYQAALARAGKPGVITTEIGHEIPFYFAEAYHQQYLARHPDGYCGLAGTGVAFSTEPEIYPEIAP